MLLGRYGFGVVPTTDPAYERGQRARTALMGLAWAYMSALSRSEADRARMVLRLFQTKYNEYRALLVSIAPNPTTAAAVLPSSIAIDGLYGSQSRSAFIPVLFNAAVLPGLTSEAMLSIPSTSTTLGAWFQRVLGPITPAASTILDIDRMARTTPVSEVFAAVGSWVFGYVEGMTPAPVEERALPPVIADTPAIPSREPVVIPEGTPSGSMATTPSSTPRPRYTQTITTSYSVPAPLLVTGSSRRAWLQQNWPFVAGVIGVTAALVLLGYHSYKQGKKRRRRR